MSGWTLTEDERSARKAIRVARIEHQIRRAWFVIALVALNAGPDFRPARVPIEQSSPRRWIGG